MVLINEQNSDNPVFTMHISNSFRLVPMSCRRLIKFYWETILSDTNATGRNGCLIFGKVKQITKNI